jgi:hypothetical protein
VPPPTDSVQAPGLALHRRAGSPVSVNLSDPSDRSVERWRQRVKKSILFPRGVEGSSEAYPIKEGLDLKTSPWKADA